jgi:hypothetical protein
MPARRRDARQQYSASQPARSRRPPDPQRPPRRPGSSSDHNVEIGNPADAPQLALAIERTKRRTGNPPHAVTVDRGYGETKVEQALHELGVRHVAIPRKSKPSAPRREFEHRRACRKNVKWRTGCERRINHRKHSHDWVRIEPVGIDGAHARGATEPCPQAERRGCQPELTNPRIASLRGELIMMRINDAGPSARSISAGHLWRAQRSPPHRRRRRRS